MSLYHILSLLLAWIIFSYFTKKNTLHHTIPHYITLDGTVILKIRSIIYEILLNKTSALLLSLSEATQTVWRMVDKRIIQCIKFGSRNNIIDRITMR